MPQPSHSPAAERNRQPILQVLQALLPATGHALEVASGTGQHV
ncbi:MAG: class I SAM-dependent methyltransferase, partial [Burkholderiaceae bacterium]|nr:class I SAM-dependent methyltransferase [Burkholderiaceae bacterium]